jgi:hypothetical protein
MNSAVITERMAAYKVLDYIHKTKSQECQHSWKAAIFKLAQILDELSAQGNPSGCKT